MIHKENGGVSSARNAALDLCTPGGDLVAFVDSDDWLELNMYETLLEQIYLYKDVYKRQAQRLTATGKVTDAAGLEVIGASVLEKRCV